MIAIKVIPIKTRYGTYDTRLESNHPEKGYTVTVTKLRGIVTCGDTIAEAKKMAREAIEVHCEWLLSDGFAEVRALPRQRTHVLV